MSVHAAAAGVFDEGLHVQVNFKVEAMQHTVGCLLNALHYMLLR